MGAIETHRLFFLTSRAIQPEARLISNQFLPKTAGTSNRDLLESAGLIIKHLPYSCRTLILIHQCPVPLFGYGNYFFDISELIWPWSKPYDGHTVVLEYILCFSCAKSGHHLFLAYRSTSLSASVTVSSAQHCVAISTGHEILSNHTCKLHKVGSDLSSKGRTLRGNSHLVCSFQEHHVVKTDTLLYLVALIGYFAGRRFHLNQWLQGKLDWPLGEEWKAGCTLC